jgi:hypothetical protein
VEDAATESGLQAHPLQSSVSSIGFTFGWFLLCPWRALYLDPFAFLHDPARVFAKFSDFLALWKDADSDIPILKQAKAEYAKLR